MPFDVIAGRFQLERLLGRGGMSEVWLAHDLELERLVAVKLLLASGTAPRFEREARSAASLSHPNIVGVFDYGEFEGRPYLVLEYVPGGTLAERLSAVSPAPLPDEQVAKIAQDLAAGLAHAHEHGIVHRDLKPSNVLFDGEGRARIADFGVARALSDATLTTTGAVVGTAQYMAPEQAGGADVGPESDVYAFGVILFQMLAGRPPFEAEHPVAEMVTKSWQEAPPVETFRPDAPLFLSALAASALSLDRRARPPDGAALVAALGSEAPPSTASTVETAVIPPPPVTGRVPPPSGRRRRSLLALAAAIGLLALVGFGASMLLTRGEEDAPAAPGSTNRGTTAPRLLSTQSQPSATGPVTTAEDSPATTTQPPATEQEATTAPPTETAPTATEPGTTTSAEPATTTLP
jgi:eukaryotic-like serine/threonine-protein kinase